MQRLILAAAFAGAASLAAAQDGPESGAYLEPPGLLPLPYRGEEVAMEPEVTIIETGQERIYEYRVRGQLYMVKVQPQIGPPYYLLDTTGMASSTPVKTGSGAIRCPSGYCSVGRMW